MAARGAAAIRILPGLRGLPALFVGLLPAALRVVGILQRTLPGKSGGLAPDPPA